MFTKVPANSNAIVASVFVGCLNSAHSEKCDDHINVLLGDIPNPEWGHTWILTNSSDNFTNSWNDLKSFGKYVAITYFFNLFIPHNLEK